MYPEQWEQATTPTRATALRAAGLRTPDDDRPPQPTDSDHPPPEVWCTVLERGHYYVVAAATTFPGQQWLVKGTDTMLAPAGAPPGAGGDPITAHKVLRDVLQPGDKPPARAPARVTSGRAGYHLGLTMLCLTQWIKRRWPSTGTPPWIWAISTAHTQFDAGPDTRTAPAPPGRNTPLKVLPWVVEGAGGLGAGKTSGAGTRGVSLDVVIGGRTGDTDTNGGESSDNRSKVHADCGPAENPSL